MTMIWWSMAENLLKLLCKIKQKASKMMKGKQTNTKDKRSNQPKQNFSLAGQFCSLAILSQNTEKMINCYPLPNL